MRGQSSDSSGVSLANACDSGLRAGNILILASIVFQILPANLRLHSLPGVFYSLLVFLTTRNGAQQSALTVTSVTFQLVI